MGLLDDEIVVGFVFAVLAAIVVAALPLEYKQAILAPGLPRLYQMGGGLTVLGFKGGRQILRDKAEVIGAGLQVGIDEVKVNLEEEETLEIDIPDEWEAALVEKVVTRLQAKSLDGEQPTFPDDLAKG